MNREQGRAENRKNVGAGQTALPVDLEQAAIEQTAAWFLNGDKLGLVRHWPHSVYQVFQPTLSSPPGRNRPPALPPLGHLANEHIWTAVLHAWAPTLSDYSSDADLEGKLLAAHPSPRYREWVTCAVRL